MGAGSNAGPHFYWGWNDRAQQRDCEAIATQREEIVTAGQPVGTADPEYVTDEVRDGRDLH